MYAFEHFEFLFSINLLHIFKNQKKNLELVTCFASNAKTKDLYQVQKTLKKLCEFHKTYSLDITLNILGTFYVKSKHTQLNVCEKEELTCFLYLIQIFGKDKCLGLQE